MVKTRKKKKVRRSGAGDVFRSHARKLGIPEKGCSFAPDTFEVSWTGSGEKCAEILSSVQKKVMEAGFEKCDVPMSSKPGNDPIGETLAKLELIPNPRREAIFKKTSDVWTATLMTELNLGESPSQDSAGIYFFIEPKERKEEA